MGKSSDLPALPRQVSGNAPRDPVARRPLVPALVWIGLMLLTLPLTGCRSFSPAYAAYLAGTLGIVAGSLLFLDAIYRKGASRPFAAFRKFTGYSVVAFYILHSLPRVEWSNAHSIGEGRAVFLYALTLACTAAGIALHTVMGRKPVLVTFGVMSAEEARDPALLKKNRKSRGKGLVGSTLEWVDVFAYAVIAVLLVQTFVFQLFVVPSESMVPVFLGGDRPFTASLIAGPHLPLTMWRLPFLKQPARGDVVMLTNPRYAENHDVNLKRYLAQALYKVTFTLVNIDRTTASGEEKADPLVKRIVGVPGEKLMMVDDVLYARSAADAEFRLVAEDAARYSQVDLWKLPEGIRTRVKTLPIDSRIRDVLAKWDARKNAADPAVLAAGLADSWSRLEKRLAGLPSSVLSAFERTELPGANPAIASLRNEAEKAAPAGAENAFSISGITTEDLSTALALCHSPSARAAMAEFATAGARASAGATAYERGSRTFNLFMKGNLVARLDRDIELIAAGAGVAGISADTERSALVTEARELSVYLALYDMRNFPEFPAGSSFLGPEQYFAMGDNRYNSLDFRYGESHVQRALDPADPASIGYSSDLAPFALEKRFIDGYALLRVWPLSRIGLIR